MLAKCRSNLTDERPRLRENPLRFLVGIQALERLLALLLDVGDALYMRAPEDFVVLLSCDTTYAVDDDATHRLVF